MNWVSTYVACERLKITPAELDQLGRTGQIRFWKRDDNLRRWSEDDIEYLSTRPGSYKLYDLAPPRNPSPDDLTDEPVCVVCGHPALHLLADEIVQAARLGVPYGDIAQQHSVPYAAVRLTVAAALTGKKGHTS